MRRLLKLILDFVLIISFVAGLILTYLAIKYYFPKGLPHGGFEMGVQKMVSDANRLMSAVQRELDELRSLQQDAQASNTPPTVPEFDLQKLAPRLKKLKFRTITLKDLERSSVQINSCAHAFFSKSEPKQTKVYLGSSVVYVIKKRAILEQENINPCLEPLGKTVLIFESQKKITGFVEVDFETQSEGVFNLAQLRAGNFNKNLIWSIHTGGADMKIDHILINLKKQGRVDIQLSFVKSFSQKSLVRTGHVFVDARFSSLIASGGGRGRFITIPKRVLSDAEYEKIYLQMNEKFSPVNFALPSFERFHDSNEPVYVLRQHDGSRLDHTPLWAERFVYDVIEWRDGDWHAVMESPVAQAFFQAVSKMVFKDLSMESGETRNWMLGSWASYKALLGEWDEAKEIVKAKTDEAAARRQQCTLEEIVSNLTKDSTLDDLKLAYILMESRGQTKWAGPNCRPEPLVNFLNREIKSRGFLASNAGH